MKIHEANILCLYLYVYKTLSVLIRTVYGENNFVLCKLLLLGFNPSAWGHLNPSSYCDVGRLFYGVFKLWSKLQRKKMKK